MSMEEFSASCCSLATDGFFACGFQLGTFNLYLFSVLYVFLQPYVTNTALQATRPTRTQ